MENINDSFYKEDTRALYIFNFMRNRLLFTYLWYYSIEYTINTHINKLSIALK